MVTVGHNISTQWLSSQDGCITFETLHYIIWSPTSTHLGVISVSKLCKDVGRCHDVHKSVQVTTAVHDHGTRWHNGTWYTTALWYKIDCGCGSNFTAAVPCGGLSVNCRSHIIVGWQNIWERKLTPRDSFCENLTWPTMSHCLWHDVYTE